MYIYIYIYIYKALDSQIPGARYSQTNNKYTNSNTTSGGPLGPAGDARGGPAGRAVPPPAR